MKIRTRFAPSPTGYLHIGGARTTLFNALFALKHHGVFILRIEDTDLIRSEERFAQLQQADIHWLGINWQEGPGVDGPYGPYWQSQRQEIYNRYYKILEAEARVYPCFCSDQELNLSRKLQLSRGIPPKYAGTCRYLTPEEIEKKLSAGMKPTLRFIVPPNEIISFKDLIRGEQKFRSDDIGDFIVRRADGTPPFLFCNAIDDAEMKVSHVFRGDDHIPNTPRQILIFEALKLPIPEYAHLSLIVGDDGSPLSKRHGSYSLEDMRKAGYLPIAIVNYLARLGHSCESQELLTVAQLAALFNEDKISRSHSRFDDSQLMFWQKLAVQSMDESHYWQWVGEEVEEIVPDEQANLFVETIKPNVAFPADALVWAKILFTEHVHIDPNAYKVVKEAGEQFFVEAENAVDKYGVDLSAILAEMKNTLGVSGKKLFMPLRVALTGRTDGPEMVHLSQILGEAKMKQRFSHAFQIASSK